MAPTRVALFVTCLTDTLFPEVGRATVEVLERFGLRVDFPAEQTCCGQMHANGGYRSAALSLARRFLGVFERFDVVVAPSASCIGAVREIYPQLAREAGDTELEHRAHSMAKRAFELSEFLVNQLGIEDPNAWFPHRVVYHPTCHSLRVARIGEAPLVLLKRVRELETVELPRADECCGFGGTFSLKNADTSSAILADKCAAIVSTGAEVCTAVDASCLLQIGGGLRRRQSSVRTVHLAEILASAEG